MTSLIEPLNKYVFRPIYKLARKKGLSKQKSLYFSHIPGALLESGPFWIFDWKVGLGVFLASEALMPLFIYKDNLKKKNRLKKKPVNRLENHLIEETPLSVQNSPLIR